LKSFAQRHRIFYFHSSLLNERKTLPGGKSREQRLSSDIQAGKQGIITF